MVRAMATRELGTDIKNVLITGASSGMGRSLAGWFARRGARVYAAARRLEALEQLSEETKVAGGNIEAVRMDVNEHEETVEQIRKLDERCGGLDVVVANAGIGGETDGKKLRWEDVEKILRVNVTGSAATLCAALPRMVERRRGHLVGISSIAAWRGLAKRGAYCGSKAFLSTFLESLRADLRGTGVKVTTVHPGFVRSELTAKNTFKMPFILETEDAAERIGKAILRGARELSFPWQLSLPGRSMKLLPRALLEAAERSLTR